MKQHFLSFFFCLCAFLSYAQEDLRDYLVGEYEYSSIETYSDEEGEFNENGKLKISKHQNDSTLFVEVISGERVINAYLLKLLKKKDSAIVLYIPKHESPKSKYFVQCGKKQVDFKSEKVEGVYFISTKTLKFFIYTDMVYVKEHGTKLFQCKKVK